MQFEYDPENLIQVVSKRPGIWDYDHPDYREKKLRMKLWNEVVQELMQTDVSMTKGEMRELGKYFKETFFSRFVMVWYLRVYTCQKVTPARW